MTKKQLFMGVVVLSLSFFSADCGGLYSKQSSGITNSQSIDNGRVISAIRTTASVVSSVACYALYAAYQTIKFPIRYMLDKERLMSQIANNELGANVGAIGCSALAIAACTVAGIKVRSLFN